MYYADLEYYKNEYKGSIIPDEELARQIDKASDQIDSMTYNRIVSIGFDNLTPFQQNKIKKAVCSQADFLYQYGPYLEMPLTGYSAGSISLSFKPVEAGGDVKTSSEVMNLLKASGLTNRRL